MAANQGFMVLKIMTLLAIDHNEILSGTFFH